MFDMSTSMNKKFIVGFVPRTGSNALMSSLSAAGKSVCDGEPFWLAQRRKMNLIDNFQDHIGLTKKLFEKYDGFRILINQTNQLKEMCNENNAGLILIRRNDYLATLASQIILLANNSVKYYQAGQLSPKSYDTWTSTSRKMVYDPNNKMLVWLNEHIDQMLYANYLIDNIFPAYSNYVTTINYENPTQGLKDLEEYFSMKIPLTLAASRPLSDYFVNHEEFKSDIEAKIKNEINGVQHD